MVLECLWELSPAQEARHGVPPLSVSGEGHISSAFAGKSSTSPEPPLLLSLQGLSGTVFQLQRPQHLPPVHRVPGSLRLLHASPVHVGNREYPALLHGASALLRHHFRASPSPSLGFSHS